MTASLPFFFKKNQGMGKLALLTVTGAVTQAWCPFLNSIFTSTYFKRKKRGFYKNYIYPGQNEKEKIKAETHELTGVGGLYTFPTAQQVRCITDRATGLLL